MYSRSTALVGLALVLAPLTASAIDTQQSPLADAAFRDWSGVRTMTTLSDESVLSEYIALTHSRDTEGALLEVVFVPRFSCTPMVRVIVPEQRIQSLSEQGLIQLAIDDELFAFPAVADSDSALREYSFSAGHSRQQQLRSLLDSSSHLMMQHTVAAGEQEAAIDSDADEPIRFSLLGSRLSVEAVEAHCLSHTAIPFELPVPD